GLRAISQKGFYEFWQAQNPDILCIQETKCHPDQLEEESLTLQGWHGYWCSASRAGYSGTATFTKTVPIDVQCGFGIRKFDTEGRVVITRFKDFVLYNCYFPNGGSGMERHEFKQEFLRRFGQHVIRLMRSGEKVIVVGDY